MVQGLGFIRLSISPWSGTSEHTWTSFDSVAAAAAELCIREVSASSSFTKGNSLFEGAFTRSSTAACDKVANPCQHMVCVTAALLSCSVGLCSLNDEWLGLTPKHVSSIGVPRLPPAAASPDCPQQPATSASPCQHVLCVAAALLSCSVGLCSLNDEWLGVRSIEVPISNGSPRGCPTFSPPQRYTHLSGSGKEQFQDDQKQESSIQTQITGRRKRNLPTSERQ